MITAIMPTTAKRRQLWDAAIRGFAMQTWKDARLLIAVDAKDVADDMSILLQLGQLAHRWNVGARVDAIITDEKSLGGKRNKLCEVARTRWIAFWDDDDWNAPRRLSLTARAIESLTTGALFAVREPIMLGSHTMMIHEICAPARRTFTYEWAGPEPYFVGGLLCFERALWEDHRFKDTGPEATIGDEAWWQLSIHEPNVFRYAFTVDPTLYCAFIHKQNTSNTQAPTGDRSWRPYGENLVPLPVLMGGAEELRIWEDAHARMLVDVLLDRGGRPGDLVPHDRM